MLLKLINTRILLFRWAIKSSLNFSIDDATSIVSQGCDNFKHAKYEFLHTLGIIIYFALLYYIQKYK